MESLVFLGPVHMKPVHSLRVVSVFSQNRGAPVLQTCFHSINALGAPPLDVRPPDWEPGVGLRTLTAT